MTIGQRIKKYRSACGLSQVALADLVNVSKQTLYKYENDIITNIPSNKIEEIASVLHVDPSVLMGWDDDSSLKPFIESKDILPIKKHSFPMLGEIACGQPILANETFETYITTDMDISADFCLRAHGDSMINARIFDGDVVFIHKQDVVDNGDIAAVSIDDEVTLKRVYYYPEDQILRLQPENPQYAPKTYSGEELDHIHILGKAVFFQSTVR